MRRKSKWFSSALMVVLLVTLMSVPSTAATQKATEVKTNANGETYGTLLAEGQTPDLVAAIATNGKEGYVRQTDLEGDLPTCPEEAVAMQKNQKDRIIPVYEKDGVTKIGEFIVTAPNNEQELAVSTRASSRAKSTAKIITFGSRTFKSVSTISLSSGMALGQGEVSVNSGGSVKAGYIGVRAYVMKSNGSIAASEGPSYNGSDGSLGLIIAADYRTSTGTYYAKSKAYLWDGLKYHTYDSFNTPKLNF